MTHCCDGELMQQVKHKFARALPHFAEKILFIVPGVTKSVARVEPRWEDGVFVGASARNDELHLGAQRHAQGSDTWASRGN